MIVPVVSEQLYRLVVEATGMGYVAIDADGRVVDANREYVRLTGHRNLDEIRGRSVIEWIAPYEVEKNAAAVKKCAREGFIRNLEIDYIHEDKSIVPVEIAATVAAHEKSVLILILCRDISVRRSSEQRLAAMAEFEGFVEQLTSVFMALAQKDFSVRLARKEDRTQLDVLSYLVNAMIEELAVVFDDAVEKERYFASNVIESLAEMLIVLDGDARICRVNRKVLDILGFEETELIGKPFDALSGPDSGIFNAIASLGEKPEIKENAAGFVNKQGELVPVLISGRPLMADSGAIEGVVLSAKDERDSNLLRKLQSTQQQLVQTAKLTALGEMAAGIAHEINTPLAIISTLSGQLKELLDEERIENPVLKEMALSIESTSFRIARIITGLRAYSRDGSADPFSVTSIQTVLESTLSLCAESLKHHGIKLILENGSPDFSIECRLSEISQVLLNLVNNARDAVESSEERWIGISVKDRVDRVEISVSDSGRGIPPETAERLFRPFYTTKAAGKGTGLGLSISRKIIENHGGKLYLDAGFKNTRFVVELPKLHEKRI